MIQHLYKLVPEDYQNKYAFCFYFSGDYIITKFISMGLAGEFQCGYTITPREYDKLAKKMIKGVIKKIDKKVEDIANNMVKQITN